MSETNRTALITGSGRNIGRACAVRLAGDGFNVVVNGSADRAACDETARLCADAGAKTLVAMGDIGAADGCRAIADAAIAEFGGIDVLINNAAIRPSAPFLEMDEAEWDQVMAVGMKSAFWLARAALPGMVERGWGRIINFAGMNAIQGYNGRAHVSTAKHAAWGLTKALAKEFGPKGVTVNIVSPGPIAGERKDPEMAKHIADMASRVPLGRIGTPEEVSVVVGMLCGQDGAFVNGQMLQVNGGAET